MDIESIMRKNKAKRKSYLTEEAPKNNSKIKYFRNLISRVLITMIFVLGSIIYTNIDKKNEELYKKYVFLSSLEFSKFNQYFSKIFGSVDFQKKDADTSVFLSQISYSNMENYQNGVKLTTGINRPISVITSGIVVFIGEKENLGNTLIVQGNDGVDIWYSNITDSDIKVYDYIESGSIIGTSNSEDIYLTIMRDGKYLSYEEYQALN